MIARLSGIVIERAPGVVIVETGGVGYTVRVPATLALQLRDGDSVTLHTHFHVREDAQELFGFLDQTALLFFEQYIFLYTRIIQFHCFQLSFPQSVP